MTIKETIDVLQLVKRREIKHNDKINRSVINPTGSIGAKAIDEAIAFINSLQTENSELKKGG